MQSMKEEKLNYRTILLDFVDLVLFQGVFITEIDGKMIKRCSYCSATADLSENIDNVEHDDFCVYAYAKKIKEKLEVEECKE